MAGLKRAGRVDRMTGTEADSEVFAAVAAEPPTFGIDDAVAIARDRYGLEVAAEPLVSERDQNFRLRTADGERRVLKIASAAEDPVVTDCQTQALLHIAAKDRRSVKVPGIVETLDGRSHLVLERDGTRHVIRLVTYLPGRPLSGVTLNHEICRDLGQRLAGLDAALADFDHPGAERQLLWDLKRAGRMRDLLVHIADERTVSLLNETLDQFEAFALPRLDSLRRQVIHNDANPGNLLVGEDERHVVGIIDFGDMLRSPLIVELAVAAAYLRALTGNPLALICELIAGFHSVIELHRAEIDVLHDLIKARLCMTVAILAWRESMRGNGDRYLRDAAAAEETALAFLERLAEIPRSNAGQIYSQVCASVTGRRQPLL